MRTKYRDTSWALSLNTAPRNNTSFEKTTCLLLGRNTKQCVQTIITAAVHNNVCASRKAEPPRAGCRKPKISGKLGNCDWHRFWGKMPLLQKAYIGEIKLTRRLWLDPHCRRCRHGYEDVTNPHTPTSVDHLQTPVDHVCSPARWWTDSGGRAEGRPAREAARSSRSLKSLLSREWFLPVFVRIQS